MNSFELVSVDRAGQVSAMTDDRRFYDDVRVSPDGSRVAVEVRGDEQDIWIVDPIRGTWTRFTVGGGESPVWSPDAARIAYWGNDGIYWKPADGSGEAERLTTSEVM